MEFCRSCGLCCLKTEMELSKSDIELIEKSNPFGWNSDQFCELKDNLHVLKNINGHCIFLHPQNNQCVIYENRPTGCRYYPLIYDIDKDRCVLDSDCPQREKFYRHASDRTQMCKNLRKWVHAELFRSD
jgi:Fe-S-cluster containining protein